jgi:hypothetical protein
MEDKQLEMFEERVNKAVSFIETLKAKEKTLVDEKEDIQRKVEELQEEIDLKDRKIEELLESQVFLKNKIETVLNKLESLDNFDADITEDEKPDADETPTYGYDKSESLNAGSNNETSGEIYVEENFVDLKDENETEEDSDQQETTISTPQTDQKPLFGSTDNNNPFIDM